jgi:hypothetical protein
MENRISTNIEQSKHLFELGLDPNTADMNWWGNEKIGDEYILDFIPYSKKSVYYSCLPAWSLSALLEVMPKNAELIKMENDAHELYYEVDYMFTGYEDSDPITAAYEMVCYLLEQGFIKKGGEV